MSRNIACMCVLVCICPVFVGCVSGPTVWTPEVTSEMTIDAAALTRLEAETHNGEISYDGSTATPDVVNITIIKRAGGLTIDDAEKAFEAVDVYIEDIGGGVKRIAWRWSKPRSHRWGAEVKLHIKGSAKLPLAAESHNGRIFVTNHAAEANLETYNGRVNVESTGDTLRVETHNGRIIAQSSASDLKLITYNGRIEADLTDAKNIGGELTTHNGSIMFKIAKDASFDLECDTHNGDIDFEMPVMLNKSSRGHINARVGNGGSRLDVETYNGNIKVENAG